MYWLSYVTVNAPTTEVCASRMICNLQKLNASNICCAMYKQFCKTNVKCLITECMHILSSSKHFDKFDYGLSSLYGM